MKKETTEIALTLGCKARDRITGYAGIVIGRTEWINGCNRITIQAQTLKDGVPVAAQTFDQQQVEVMESAAVVPRALPAGGPMPDVERRAEPGAY